MAVTVEAVDSYHALRNNTAWDGLDTAAKNAALARAEDYIVATYYPLVSDLEDDNPRLVAAFALLANEFRAAMPDLKTAQTLKSKEVTSGDDTIKKTYQDSDKETVKDPYPLVTAMIAPLRVNQRGSGVSFGQMI